MTKSNLKSKRTVKKNQVKKYRIEKALTFTKKVVLGVLIMAELQICCTYVLAFLDKTQVAETLSTQTTVTIVGVVLAYCVKALFENLSKYGNTFCKKNEEQEKEKDDIESCKDEEENAG